LQQFLGEKKMKLIQSSEQTRKWLCDIYELLKSHNIDYTITESKYWATFRKKSVDKVFSHCNPSAHKIRVFLPIEEKEFPDLTKTPSTNEWADRYPTIFRIEGEKDIKRSVDLLIIAYIKTK